MNSGTGWKGFLATLIISGVVIVLVFDPPRLLIRRVAVAAGSTEPELLATLAVTVLGAAIATRHWMAPTFLTTAFVILPALSRAPIRSESGWQLILAGLYALSVLFIVTTLLLVSLALIVLGVARQLRPRPSGLKGTHTKSG
jgi:hypothetical protein